MGKMFDGLCGAILMRLRTLPALASADGGLAPQATLGVAQQVRKRGVLVVALVIALAGFTWALWPKPVGVDVVVVSAGPMTVTVDEEVSHSVPGSVAFSRGDKHLANVQSIEWR